MMNNILVTERSLCFNIDSSLYSNETLYKCFYWYGAQFIVSIENDQLSKSIHISLEQKSDIKEIIDANKTVEKIKNDLIDFKLRDIVLKETQNIRDLIVAKAFAFYQEDADPVTEISDPVGFEPVQLS